MGATGEISRESLVRILEIMHRLAAPEAMPELLREIVEVGKVAIVAEAGVLWLKDRSADDLVMVIPGNDPPLRLPLGTGWAGRCAVTGKLGNVTECGKDALFQAHPVVVAGVTSRSLLTLPILGQDDTVLGVMQWIGSEPGQFDEHDEWIGPTLAAQAAVAVQHSYMTDQLLADAILKQEVAVAREIQMSTLPRVMPQVPGYDMHGHFLPTDHTGGDLFDLVEVDREVFLLLGDATGHGFGPALSATQMQAMLRVAFRLGADLDAAYRHVNNQLVEDLPDDRFITAFIGLLDPRHHTVRFHSAGQGPILHFSAASGHCEWYKPTSFPMGVMDLAGATAGARLTLAPGDILGLISDGIYESARPDGSEFGESGVGDVVRAGHGLPMATLCERLVAAARSFSRQPQADDITLVLVKRLAE